MAENAALIDNKYVLGARSSVVDSRRKWEDRVFVGQIERQDGAKLIVGIVADGVGSADYGSRGAQLAIDQTVEYIKTGAGQNIPLLIKNAIEFANNSVYQENQQINGDGLTTLVVAIIQNDHLFVGNVGDSRAYWVQAPSENRKTGKMLQLTRDHSYFNIYGGNLNDEHAGALVNSIGNEETVQVDLGFYLKGPDIDTAYKLGLTGLPLKPGDSVLLCSDGLIKCKPGEDNIRYATDEEIVDAIDTEFESEKAVVKMISRAEGRMPDDNVSAVTIQYLNPELVKQVKARSITAQRMRVLRKGLIALGSVGALAVIAILVINLTRTSAIMNNLQNQPTQTPVILVSTPLPTLIPIQIGQAIVDYIKGNGANVTQGSLITSGETISSGNGLVGLRIREITNQDGFIYLFPDSSAQIIYSQEMSPILISGAMYIQPGSPRALVNLSQFQEGLTASVSGSRMVIDVDGDDLWIYCFEGKCLLEPADGNPMRIPEGSKMLYRLSKRLADTPIVMSYSEKWNWNLDCEKLCLSGFLATPTPVAEPSQKATPTINCPEGMTTDGKGCATTTCDDRNKNTIDTLAGDKCVFTLIDCDDKNPDTQDTLTEGICTNICDDGNPDTVDTKVNGQCNFTPNCKSGETFVNGHCEKCNDHDSSTIDEIVDGVCIHKTPIPTATKTTLPTATKTSTPIPPTPTLTPTAETPEPDPPTEP